MPWKLIDDPVFIDVKNVLDNVMKERAQESIGTVKRQAEFILLEYEEHLWKSGTLGEDTPDKLGRHCAIFARYKFGIKSW